MSVDIIDTPSRKLVSLTVGDIRLVIEALERAAARHESMGRFRPQSAAKHDSTAAEMRQLRAQFMRALQVGAA